MKSVPDKIKKDISLRCYIPLEVVEAIVDGQFQFLYETIRSGDRRNPESLKNINITHIGKFAVKPARKKFYEKLKEENGGE